MHTAHEALRQLEEEGKTHTKPYPDRIVCLGVLFPTAVTHAFHCFSLGQGRAKA